MALTGGYHSATGSAVALSSFLPTGSFKQIDIFANDGNAAAVYIGPSTVTTAGVDAYISLSPGKAWGHVVGRAEQMSFDLASLYIIGTSSDKAHIAIVK
jgi:hypothetical protein